MEKAKDSRSEGFKESEKRRIQGVGKAKGSRIWKRKGSRSQGFEDSSGKPNKPEKQEKPEKPKKQEKPEKPGRRLEG